MRSRPRPPPSPATPAPRPSGGEAEPVEHSVLASGPGTVVVDTQRRQVIAGHERVARPCELLVEPREPIDAREAPGPGVRRRELPAQLTGLPGLAAFDACVAQRSSDVAYAQVDERGS